MHHAKYKVVKLTIDSSIYFKTISLKISLSKYLHIFSIYFQMLFNQLHQYIQLKNERSQPEKLNTVFYLNEITTWSDNPEYCLNPTYFYMKMHWNNRKNVSGDVCRRQFLIWQLDIKQRYQWKSTILKITATPICRESYEPNLICLS